jgi:hypothetical protein
MHIPTPHLHKTDKRKASIDSVAHSDHSATQHVEPKPVKTTKKAKKRRAKKMKVKKEDREKTPEDVDVNEDSDANNHPLYSSSPAAVPEPIPSSPPLTTTTSQQESYVFLSSPTKPHTHSLKHQALNIPTPPQFPPPQLPQQRLRNMGQVPAVH